VLVPYNFGSVKLTSAVVGPPQSKMEVFAPG